MPATVKSAARDYTSRPRNRPVPPFVMDRPILHAFVRELLGHERLHAFAEALPARARVSEPALPLVVAALHERLERPLAIVVPEDAEELPLIGYERVGGVEERGRFAVRGGLTDVFPRTGREPLRIEFFGDEVESVRAFSPFTQRTLHPLEDATIYPAAERRVDLSEPTLADEEPVVPDDLVPPLGRAPDLVWQTEEVRRVWDEEGYEPQSLEGAAELDPLPAGQPFAFEAQRPALAARGLAEAENELAGFVRAGQRVVVAFPHRGEALRTQNLLRRIEAGALEEPALPPEAGGPFAGAPPRRGFVWRELGVVLLPDTQVFRRRARPTDVRVGRALQSFADLRTGDHVVHEDHGVGKLLGFETKTVAGVTRDYLFLAFRGEDRLYVPHEQLGKVSRYFGAGKVDVLVGTHRILSRDVIPKDLGLVILDEEQRFGVAQKELLRSLRLEVDVLTLSATPIPRTLHMSLSGLRDISIIETPPEGRRPIRTHVGEYDEELIRLALTREADRGGQA